jgi:hypothetical protein
VLYWLAVAALLSLPKRARAAAGTP